MAKKRVDVFPNRAVERVVMSAANTITFEQIRFGLGVFQGVALVLHRIEFYLSALSVRELVAVADSVEVGLTNRDDLASLQMTNLNVLVSRAMLPMMVGAVVSLSQERFPLIADLATLPGGGLIIPANPMFLGMQTVGFAIVGVCDAVIYYTFKQLTDADYIELIQGMLPANI